MQVDPTNATCVAKTGQERPDSDFSDQPETNESVRAQRLETWRRRSICANSMSGAIVDQITEKEHFRRRTSEVHKGIVQQLLAHSSNQGDGEETDGSDSDCSMTAPLEKCSEKNSLQSGNFEGITTKKLNSGYCLSLLDDQTDMTDQAKDQRKEDLRILSSIKTFKSDKSKHCEVTSNEANEEILKIIEEEDGKGGEEKEKKQNFMQTRRGSLLMEDLPDQQTIIDRQLRGRRKSFQVSSGKDFKPSTTPTGTSQYPLPGSKISTMVGGSFKTTKTINNLLSESELNTLVKKENRKSGRRSSIFGN